MGTLLLLLLMAALCRPPLYVLVTTISAALQQRGGGWPLASYTCNSSTAIITPQRRQRREVFPHSPLTHCITAKRQLAVGCEGACLVAVVVSQCQSRKTIRYGE